MNDEDGGIGVVDYGGYLGRGEAPVDGDVDGTDEGPSEEEVEVVEAVAIEEGDPAADADVFVTQGVGNPAGADVLLAPCSAFLPADEHLLVRPLRCVCPDHAGNREALLHRCDLPHVHSDRLNSSLCPRSCQETSVKPPSTTST